MAGWHHRLGGCESERTPGVGDGQGGLACCNSWGCKESDTTEDCTELNVTELYMLIYIFSVFSIADYYKIVSSPGVKTSPSSAGGWVQSLVGS